MSNSYGKITICCFCWIWQIKHYLKSSLAEYPIVSSHFFLLFLKIDTLLQLWFLCCFWKVCCQLIFLVFRTDFMFLPDYFSLSLKSNSFTNMCLGVDCSESHFCATWCVLSMYLFSSFSSRKLFWGLYYKRCFVIVY